LDTCWKGIKEKCTKQVGSGVKNVISGGKLPKKAVKNVKMGHFCGSGDQSSQK